MIIKIIPETDIEKSTLREEEHVGVKDFFICGNKTDSDGDGTEFHTWSGKYKFLIGSLYYFVKQIENEQFNKERPRNTQPLRLNKDVEAGNKGPIIKHADNEEPINIIDIQDLQKKVIEEKKD